MYFYFLSRGQKGRNFIKRVKFLENLREKVVF